MVIRKLTLIFVVAILFGAFLIVQPQNRVAPQQASIEDRLPQASSIAILDCIALSKEINDLLYHYKVPYRDFLATDFILSQSKLYGIQVQHPLFVFFNSINDFGVLATLTEQANLDIGIERLKYFFDVKERIINKQKIYTIEQYNTHIFFGLDYICLYVGSQLSDMLQRIVGAKANQISPEWLALINQQEQLQRKNIVCTRFTEFNSFIEQCIFYPSFDSTTIRIHTILESKDTIPFTLKNDGLNFPTGEFTKRALNLHINPTYLQNHPSHPLYQYLKQQSKKIRFPFEEFIQQWSGDLSIRQGGWISIIETYIDHQLDDDFEITDVEKTRQQQVIGLDICYSMTPKTSDFLSLMQKTGFMTQQDKKYHLLLSPPLNLKKQMNSIETTHLFHTSKFTPQRIEDNRSYAMWTHKQTKYSTQIDSISTFKIYGTLEFRPEKWTWLQ